MYFDCKNMSSKTKVLSNENLEKSVITHYSSQPFTILLVDDDPLFCKIMTRVAEKKGIKVVACQSVDALAPLDVKDFNVLVMDYNLGSESPASGLEMVEYMEMVWGGLPVIMVSQSERYGQLTQWPKTVKTFVWKAQGAEKVLDLACEFGS